MEWELCNFTREDEGATVPGNKLHRIWPFSDSNALITQDRMYSAIVTSVQQGQSVSLGASLISVVAIMYHFTGKKKLEFNLTKMGYLNLNTEILDTSQR